MARITEAFSGENCKYSTLKHFQVHVNLLYAFRRLGHGNIALDVFFKNAKMISDLSSYTRFFTKPPQNIWEELDEEVTSEMSREEHKNMKTQ